MLALRNHAKNPNGHGNLGAQYGEWARLKPGLGVGVLSMSSCRGNNNESDNVRHRHRRERAAPGENHNALPRNRALEVSAKIT